MPPAFDPTPIPVPDPPAAGTRCTYTVELRRADGSVEQVVRPCAYWAACGGRMCAGDDGPV